MVSSIILNSMFKSIPSVLKHAVKVHSNVACRAISSTNSCYGRLLFSQSHEYVNVTDKTARVGISDHAQKELGDVVYVDLPQVDGQEMAAGDVAASVESVKAVAEVYSPISGVLKAVNTYLENSPGLVNLDPVADGWIIELEVTKPEELDSLMDEAAYAKYLETVE